MNQRKSIGYVDYRGSHYEIEFDSDYTLSFRNVNAGLDEAGYENSGYELSHSDHNPIRLFRKMEEIIVNYVLEERPPLIQFSTGGESSREWIYEKFCERLYKKTGYEYVKEDGYFIIYKINK